MRGRNINHLLPVPALSRDGTCKLGMCPDRESNPRLFLVYGMILPPTEPPGQGKWNFNAISKTHFFYDTFK